ADRNRSHWSTSKTPSYTKSVSWQHHHDFDVTYNDKNYSIEKEQLIRDEINKEHLTAHQNRINL
ncbi:hypothetical protein P2S52_23925, partial [Escherichia coli]